jgi:hypothetical protein
LAEKNGGESKTGGADSEVSSLRFKHISLFHKKPKVETEKTHINETEREKRMRAEFNKIRKRLGDMLGVMKRGRRGGLLETSSSHN